jgi:Single-strand binding protein family
MSDTNYIGGIVKILEKPKQRVLNSKIPIVKFRAQLPQVRNSKIVSLTFWGNLARDVTKYYKVNDYIIIEGYVSLRDKGIVNIKNQKTKKVEITVLRVYPFLLNYDRSNSKI